MECIVILKLQGICIHLNGNGNPKVVTDEDWEAESKEYFAKMEKVRKYQKIKERVQELYKNVVTFALLKNVQRQKSARFWRGPILEPLTE